MIVKNEANNIGSALDSMLPIADEIVIVDTGSSDKTMEIIGQYQDKTDKINLWMRNWDNDFSKARNFSIDNASGDWILWLDADDRIPGDQIANFNKLKTAPLNRFFCVRIINTKHGLPIGSNFMQARMFPNRSDVRFKHPIHEQIAGSCEEANLKRYFLTEVIIHHTGYDDDVDKTSKGIRNADIIKNIPDYDKNIYWMSALGDSYTIALKYDLAYNAYKDALNCEDAKLHNLYNVIHTKIGNCKLWLNEYNEALKWYNDGMDINPKNMELVYHTAYCLEKLGHFEHAADLYFKVLDMPHEVNVYALPYDVCRMYTFTRLLRILTGLRRYSQCVDLIGKMNEAYPNFDPDLK